MKHTKTKKSILLAVLAAAMVGYLYGYGGQYPVVARWRVGRVSHWLLAGSME